MAELEVAALIVAAADTVAGTVVDAVIGTAVKEGGARMFTVTEGGGGGGRGEGGGSHRLSFVIALA